jgi:hypothetical protein
MKKYTGTSCNLVSWAFVIAVLCLTSNWTKRVFNFLDNLPESLNESTAIFAVYFKVPRLYILSDSRIIAEFERISKDALA